MFNLLRVLDPLNDEAKFESKLFVSRILPPHRASGYLVDTEIKCDGPRQAVVLRACFVL